MSTPALRDLHAGLSRQLETLEGKLARGATLGGWKVGLTSGQARDSMGAGFRPFGYILENRIFASGARIDLDAFERVGVENECCFTIGRALAGNAMGNVTRDAVADAVQSVAPAFEINERRLPADAPAPDRLADDLSQWGIVAGHPRRVAGLDFESLVVTLARDGEAVESVAARGHIEDHFDSIAALAAQLSRFGRTLQPGQRIITGSFGRCPVTEPSRWSGDFGAELGVVEVEFA